MLKNLLVLSVVIISVCSDTKPFYKYRYETEDLMETAASALPLQGYHIIERGFYPGPQFSGFAGQGIGQNRFFGGFHNFGQGYKEGSFGPGFGAGFGAHNGGGGEYLDKSAYEASKKDLNDGHFEKSFGNRGDAYDYGQEGYNQGKFGENDFKEDSGYYKHSDGGKKAYEDGKTYHGGQHFNQEGRNANENKLQAGHRKGHKVKGFKTTHHKDESGKTEEYYDEANDEGKHFQYKGEAGDFGKKAQSEYKGGHQDNQFNAKEQKQQGHFETAHSVDAAKGNHGHYGEKKHAENNKAFGFNNGIDEQSLLGHQESVRAFKKFPFHTPFFHA